MKINLLILILLLSLSMFSNAQTVENKILEEQWHTQNTSNKYQHFWTRIASCTNHGGYMDFGGTIDFFGNGSASHIYYYGKLILRFKRQSATQGPATSMSMVLLNSNLGKDNIVGIRNGATIDVYLRIPYSYTCLFFRRTVSGYSHLTCFTNEPFLKELPQGDYTISCKEGTILADKARISGKVEASEIKITSAPGADFVFEEEYNKPSLEELETFIKENHHLPDIPSAQAMQEEGVELAQMNQLLLQKIEELTLYVIDLKKEITNQQQEINKLKNHENN